MQAVPLDAIAIVDPISGEVVQDPCRLCLIFIVTANAPFSVTREHLTATESSVYLQITELDVLHEELIQ